MLVFVVALRLSYLRKTNNKFRRWQIAVHRFWIVKFGWTENVRVRMECVRMQKSGKGKKNKAVKMRLPKVNEKGLEAENVCVCVCM